MSALKSRRSPSSIAPNTARDSPVLPTARSRAPRAATRVASRARPGDQSPRLTTLRSRELFTRPVASSRCAANRRLASAIVMPGPAAGARNRHHTRTVSFCLKSSMRAGSPSGRATISRRTRSAGVVRPGTVAIVSDLPPSELRSGAAMTRATISSSLVGHAPNIASRRRPASRQASPWATAPSAQTAAAKNVSATRGRPLRSIAKAKAATAAAPEASGVGRAPPQAAPKMSAAATGTIGAGRCGGVVTLRWRRDPSPL